MLDLIPVWPCIYLFAGVWLSLSLFLNLLSSFTTLTCRYRSPAYHVQAWYDEVKDYTYPYPHECNPWCPDRCSGPMCTHYTQVSYRWEWLVRKTSIRLWSRSTEPALKDSGERLLIFKLNSKTNTHLLQCSFRGSAPQIHRPTLPW